MAYTYLIGWKELDVWYYGARYAKSSKPEDLWTKYFTSSKGVKAFRGIHGEPNVIEIRQFFNSKEGALKWEETVIRRLDAVKSKRWLNRQNGGRNFISDGSPRSLECRAKISQKYQERLSDPLWKEKCAERARAASSSESARRKISDKANARFADPEWKAKHNASHQTEEFRALLSANHRKRLSDPKYVEKHLAAVRDPSYREKQRKDSTLRSQNPEYEAARIEAMKKALSDPKTRQLMSERAKASTAKRLESRRLNRLVSAN